MNVAKTIPTENRTPVLESAQGTPPPLTTVSDTGIVKKNKDSIIPCQMYRGQQVVIASDRPNRFHFNGKIGKIAAVIYPQNIDRTIIYVRLEDASPCFFAHEVCPILNQKSVGGAA